MRTKTAKRIENGDGNPSYLRAVLDCVKEEAKLLDLYPNADKEAHNTTVQQRNSGGGLSSATIDEIRMRVLGIDSTQTATSNDSQDVSSVELTSVEAS